MKEFKYTLTRICLRTGELTLPGTMLELFPDEGRVTALDTERDEEFELLVVGPRRIDGLDEFMRVHALDVNDTIVIRPLEDGRYGFEAQARPKRPKRSVVAESKHIDEIVTLLGAGGRPMTPPEIRAALPHLPDDLDVARRLADDGRVELARGRWRVADAVETIDEPAAAPESGVPAEVTGSGERPADEETAPGAGVGRSDAPPTKRVADERQDGAEVRPVRTPRPSVTPYPRGVMFPGDAALASAEGQGDLDLLNRAREALQHLGYRVEGLSGGQLMAHAELGRRTYRVLVHPLPDEQRLDWASLLARRRDTGARYLAVFGDHRDLTRLHAPAELARATLWSWHGLQRVLDLSRTVLIGPVDLEPHFERDGMVESGLERFEATVGQRIAERGAFSSLLARLATMRAPAVFLLDDVTGDTDLSRDELLKLLERLERAPFHLVSRVGNGEFCLRYRVSDALLHLSQYALSLRDQLPNRRRERVLGSDEIDPPNAAGGKPERGTDSETAESADPAQIGTRTE